MDGRWALLMAFLSLFDAALSSNDATRVFLFLIFVVVFVWLPFRSALNAKRADFSRLVLQWRSFSEQ